MQITRIVYNNPLDKNNFKHLEDFDLFKEFGQQRFAKFFNSLDIISPSDIGTDPFLFDLQFSIKDMHDILDKESDRNLFNLLAVDDNIIQAVRQGQGYFVLNLPTEGIYFKWFVDRLKEYFDYHNIHLNRIVYINNSVNGEKLRLKNHLPIRNVFYPWFIDDYAKRRRVQFRETAENKTHKFLCYNRNLHEHRIAFYNLMYKNDLLKECLYSMPLQNDTHDNYIDIANNFMYHNSNFNQLEISKDDIVDSNQILPLTLDKFNRDLINTSPDMWNHHSQSFISIVTETYFYDTNSIHITEKTFKPISFCQPFILLSTPNSLKYIKSLGFKTFNTYWDESYDKIKDPNQRMLAVIDVIKTISKWSTPLIHEFYKDVQSIVDYNKQHLQKVIYERQKISTTLWRT